MKVFGKAALLQDFIPPIAYKLMRCIGINVDTGKEDEPYVAPFLHSYSQYHEDLIVQSIFRSLENGFYVDVGANHPSILSNTKMFYDRGWHGINIEPNPLLLESFSKERPRDINLNIGISDECGEMDFYRMSADTLSTFSKKSAIDSQGTYKEKIVDVIRVNVKPLSSVLEEYCSSKAIDFMSIDVEGYDLIVLKSNNWDLFRPKILVIEINQDEGDIVRFIESVGYEIAYKNHTNALFVDNCFVKEMSAIGVAR